MVPLKRIWKLYIVYATALLTLVAVTGFVLHGQLKYRLMNQVQEQLFTLARVLAKSLPDDLDNSAHLHSWCRDYRQVSHLRITVIQSNGRVIGDSEDEIVPEDSHLDRPEVAGALVEGSSVAVRFSITMDTDMLYAAYLVEGRQVILRLAMPMSMMKQIENEVMLFFVIAVYLAPLLAIGIPFAFGRFVLSREEPAERPPRRSRC